MSYSIDIHTHTSMKPMRQNPENNLWEKIGVSPYCNDIPFIVKGVTKGVDSQSQTHLDACKEGNVRVLFFALYPPEKPMYDLRKVTEILLSEKAEINLGTCISGFDREMVKNTLQEVIYANGAVDYFQELQDEYDYLIRENNHANFIVASNYTEVKTALEANQNNIVCVMTIEGGHALCSYEHYNNLNTFDGLNDPNDGVYQKYHQIFSDNIQTIKNWGEGKHSPLFITFAHHFWNLLCGHARSFSGNMRTFGVNQNFGINKGFTGLGKSVLEMLLSRENGRRILIDTKHMSIQTRKEFYRIWSEYKANGDNFPIICSHAAVSGVESLNDRIHRRDNSNQLTGKYFNTWSINLTDEDIRYTFESEGLIGMVLHEGRMPGAISKEILDHFRGDDDNRDSMRDEYIRLLMSNIFHVIRVCNDKKAWDMICIGSDFDGLINSFDVFSDVSSMPQLYIGMLQFLYRPIPNEHVGLSVDTMKSLMFGYSPQEIIDKIKRTNVENFLERYFNDEYLRNGTSPVVV